MDCREAKTSLADLSAEQLTPDLQKQIETHFADCPPCLEEWRLFQATLSTVSQTTQPIPAPRQSREMWLACEKSWTERVERERLQASQPAFWSSPLGRWVRLQPAWGWASLGGALAVLSGVWLMDAQDVPTTDIIVPRPSTELRMIRFEQPPSVASSMLDHHAIMAFDPFADHVATTLVSYSTPSASTPSAPSASASNAASSSVPASPSDAH